MVKRMAWRLVDLVVGLLLAGVVAPFTLVVLPPRLKGPPALAGVALVCIAVAWIAVPRITGRGRPAPNR